MSRRRCECGRPKDLRAEACESCLVRDGARAADARVISVLREHGGSTSTQVLEKTLRIGKRWLLRIMSRLQTEGRVRREVTGTGESDSGKNWGGNGTGQEPTWHLVERRRRLLVADGGGQLAFGRPGFARRCVHEYRPVVSYAGRVLGEQCRVCLDFRLRTRPPARRDPKSPSRGARVRGGRRGAPRASCDFAACRCSGGAMRPGPEQGRFAHVAAA